ncbi:MAG: hypothetical protein ACTHK3_03840 [Solirubrobacterales bacterium]
MLLVVAPAEGEIDEVAVVGHGRVNGYGWSVETAPEGNSICFEVGVFRPKAPEYGSGEGQCSSPARRRGILFVISNSHRHGAPKVVAVGAAFNRAVAAVKVVNFKGKVNHLRMHHLDQTHVAELRKFKYIAFAVAGPWCARTLTTYDKHKHKLWETEWKDFDGSWRRIPGSNPVKLCPH